MAEQPAGDAPDELQSEADRDFLLERRAGRRPLRTIADLGLQIPRDVSVVRFDNIALAEMLNPRLTTVGQPIADLGERAILRVVERLRGEGSAPPSREMLPTTLQLRKSCAPPPSRLAQRAERR